MKLIMKSSRTAAVLFALGSAAASAHAQTPLEFSMTAQPTSYPIAHTAYRVKGYASATFGMTPAQVRAVIAADYPGALAHAREVVDPLDRSRTLTVTVPRLAPGPGAASIHYVFGASSGKLVGVHVDWEAAGRATRAQQEALSSAGTILTAGVVGYRWAPMSSLRGRIVAPGVIVLFAGTDEQDAAIQIRLEGVGFDVEKPQKTPGPLPVELVRRQPPPGPARLRLSAIANNSNPDVYRIPAGAF